VAEAKKAQVDAALEEHEEQTVRTQYPAILVISQPDVVNSECAMQSFKRCVAPRCLFPSSLARKGLSFPTLYDTVHTCNSLCISLQLPLKKSIPGSLGAIFGLLDEIAE